MKNFSRQFSIFLLTILVFSCQQKENVTKLAFEETMEMHDVAMAKLDEMFLLKKSLTKLKDSIASHETVDSTQVDLLLGKITALETSDEAMMSWMGQFEVSFQDEDSQTNLQYYKDQLDMITEVNTQIDDAIAAAKASLEN